MLKKIIVFSSLILLIGTVLITFPFCNGNNSAAGSNHNNSIFNEGDVYVITGEFDFGNYAIKHGSLIIEILEINDKWIRVDILDDENVKSDLREGTITRAKNEGLIKDIWINTEKILYIWTEPDLSILSN